MKPKIYFKDKIDRKLFKQELEICKNYKAKKRVNEFTIGRLAGRKALEALGISDFPILKSESGAAIWPDGVYGSISHSNNKAAAVAAKDFNLIGIDLEYLKKELNINLKKRVCTENEKKWVGDDKEKLLSIFSTKEAIYKAYYPIRKLRFKDVELTKNEKGFSVELNIDLNQKFKKNFVFNSFLDRKEDYITSLVFLESTY